MASIWRDPRTRFWVACFTNRDGRRLKKTTKETDRKKAQRMADAFEKVARNKQTAKTATDIAHDLCVLHYGKAKPALSLEDVARTSCEDIDPWVESLLGAERLAAAKTQAAKP